MQLLVSSKDRLEARFKEQGFERLCVAFKEYKDALSTQGTPSAIVLLDNAKSMAKWELPPANLTEWHGAVQAVRAVAGSSDKAGVPVDGITILGGPEIIPFCELSNPVNRNVDSDPVIYSDAPYGSDRDSPLRAYISTARSVGRIPDGGTRKVEPFLQTLRLQIRNHLDRPARSGACAFVDQAWVEPSRRVARRLPADLHFRICPGYEITDMTASDLDRRYLYFNLHGTERDSAWMAFQQSRARYVNVVKPNSFRREHISGAVIFAENCYGARIQKKTHKNSCALKAVSEGAAAFVGATGRSFSSHLTPGEFEYSDEIAERFLGHHTAGRGAGESLRRALTDYYVSARKDKLDPFERKTAFQFVVLGDPLL